ncbi:50S ribosomal protein L10 [Egibacter rhizosphaerae]|uniref:Large ribosomal subunit protein uL10 n=1 Tax=Egibacter rhizosphaerae TaxID=1670831 RepID=A0A411YGS5_9ACTN|nr:50S ribosomal protein L10 [Egibacter rhizosphaerae]QBI20444.1 50S ribosomal protein L10 [Egibacter rhizosphaerae]
MATNEEARPEKVAQVAEIAEWLEQSNATVLTDYRGLSVAATAELRRQLRETDAEYRVVKNTLTRRAVREAGVDIPDDVLVGPTAITFCAGDPVAAAKVLKRFSKSHPGLQIKAGVLDGKLLDANDAARLADLESREELLGRIAVMLGTVLAQPARLANANLEKLARVLGALQDKTPDDGGALTQAESAGSEAAGSEDAEPEAAEPEAAEPEEATEASAESGAAEETGDQAEAGDGADEAEAAETGEDPAQQT